MSELKPSYALPKMPDASPGWWETLAAMLKARPQAVEDRLYECFVKDTKLFAQDPDRSTTIRRLARQGAQALMRPTL